MKSSTQSEPALSFHKDQERGLKPYEHESLAEHKRFEGNYWIAPDCHLLGIRKQMKIHLQGKGGDLDESWLYLDPEGAAQWLALTNNKFYSPIHTLDFHFVADVIFHHWKRNQFKKKHIHVLGLGCGNGHNEIQLVRRMLDRSPEVQISLYLLDLSPILLNEAFLAAQEAFSRNPNVKITVLQGNFEHLSAYDPIIQMAQEQNELVVLPMFGFSFCNLRNDRLFVRNALRTFRRNTLFLVDILLAAAPSNEAEQIKKQDPLFLSESYFGSQEELDFLVNPLRQCRPNLQKVELYRELDYSTCADGSYAVEIRAIVDEESQFTIMRMRKYEPIKLANMFLKEGWAPVQAFPYGSEHDGRMLYLLSRS